LARAVALARAEHDALCAVVKADDETFTEFFDRHQGAFDAACARLREAGFLIFHKGGATIVTCAGVYAESIAGSAGTLANWLRAVERQEGVAA